MRALARWGFTPLLASPLAASALGLGDIELKSALNQPLQAEIGLVSATPEELEGLKISLASHETFRRYGLDRPDFLSGLQFTVARDAQGRNVIRVTSRESIAEPFVTMLIEASWPRGRLLREYTVLLDPPVLLPAPSVATAVSPPATRATDGTAIVRSEPRPAATSPSSAPAPSAVTPPRTTAVPPPAVAPGGTYTVQRADTLWDIASRMRPAGISINQMMIALYEANAQAFDGNINLLRAGAVLRVPEIADLQAISAASANAEVQRHNEAWQSGEQTARLRLLPADDVGAPSAGSPGRAAPADAASSAQLRELEGEVSSLRSQLEESQRLLALRDQELRALQERLASAEQAGATAAPAESPAAAEPEPVTAPGVDLEVEERIFAEEEPVEVPEEPFAAAEEPAPQPVEQPASPVATQPSAPAAVTTTPEPSLVSRVLGAVTNPMVLIGIGVAALLLAVVGFMRRRRDTEPEDVTGRWDALEQEFEAEEREATERLRRHAPDESFVVEEQAETTRQRAERAPRTERAAPAAAAAAAAAAAVDTDETLSAQTVIDLDQADPVAEADFHMAYGLYDQAAELITKALEQNPERRDLKLKLLDVYFVWGNKEAFLQTAQELKRDIGSGPSADWDKVVIMGKQICPDAAIFADAAAGAPEIDVDLEAGASPALDLAFDEEPESGGDGDTQDLAFSSSRRGRELTTDGLSDSLDIGERTAAGLEAALLDDDADGDRRSASVADPDSLAVTQESPTIERPSSGLDWTALSPTTELAAGEAPTVETPTIETAAADAPTMETPTVETAAADAPTMETPTVETAFWRRSDDGDGSAEDGTAEIDLDDLGLDVTDLEALPAELGEPADDSASRAGREVGTDSDLLSATGVTQVLDAGADDLEQRETAVLGDDEATMLASLDDTTLTGTEVLNDRFKVDSTGETSLVKSLGGDGLDLDLDDFSAALGNSAGDTVEQPRGFGEEVFSEAGGTPLDLDVGLETIGSDDPTGTEASPLDPQTMTEVGTKLDLARAYIDMGDPEGARSILEEVLDEGDAAQRREAQSLIDALSA